MRDRAGARRPSDRRLDQAPDLAPLVRWWWIERRGDDWAPAPIEPWHPTRDRHGRVVIRRPFSATLVRFGSLGLNGMAFTVGGVFFGFGSAPPMQPPVITAETIVVIWIFVLAVVVAVWWWVTVTVDDDEVVIRSFAGRIRVSRVDIVGIAPVNAPVNACTPRKLALRRRSGFTHLPVPITSDRPELSDPDFYRIWAWLDQELTRHLPPPPLPTGASDRLDTSGGRVQP